MTFSGEDPPGDFSEPWSWALSVLLAHGDNPWGQATHVQSSWTDCRAAGVPGQPSQASASSLSPLTVGSGTSLGNGLSFPAVPSH